MIAYSILPSPISKQAALTQEVGKWRMSVAHLVPGPTDLVSDS